MVMSLKEATTMFLPLSPLSSGDMAMGAASVGMVATCFPRPVCE